MSYPPPPLPPPRTVATPAPFFKSPRIMSFYGGKMMVRRADGAILSAAVPPYPAMLYASVRGQRWEEAVRLCR